MFSRFWCLFCLDSSKVPFLSNTELNLSIPRVCLGLEKRRQNFSGAIASEGPRDVVLVWAGSKEDSERFAKRYLPPSTQCRMVGYVDVRQIQMDATNYKRHLGGCGLGNLVQEYVPGNNHNYYKKRKGRKIHVTSFQGAHNASNDAHRTLECHFG